MTNLQYRLSNGKWVNCAERNAEFLARCIVFAGYFGRDEQSVLTTLANGKAVQNGEGCFDQCRDADLAASAAAAFEAGAAARATAATARRAADGYFNHQ